MASAPNFVSSEGFCAKVMVGRQVINRTERAKWMLVLLMIKVEFESSLKDMDLLGKIVGMFMLGRIVLHRLCMTYYKD